MKIKQTLTKFSFWDKTFKCSGVKKKTICGSNKKKYSSKLPQTSISDIFQIFSTSKKMQ